MIAGYVRRKHYEAIELDGEWIVLNTDDYSVTKLNEVGGFCWTLLSGAQSVNSIIEAIRKEYELVNETVEMDIEAFLAEMVGLDLVQHAAV
jgi:hypothetical protein